MPPVPALPEPAHIGDGVYVRFDGYHLRLAVNHHLHEVVALEPEVLRNLILYARRINLTFGDHFIGVGQ